MGLDITAYSRLTAVGQHLKDPAKNEGEPGGLNDWCYYDNHVQAFAYDCFPASFRGIPVLRTDVRSGTGFLHGGCYATTEATETHDFRAGSYGGYNAWRDDLREQFNPDQSPDGPFYELIWFADNEGCIGELAAADLLADFREHARTYVAPEGWGRQKYEDWTRAFELAADGGLVRFH
jgi:hypothetical protein